MPSPTMPTLPLRAAFDCTQLVLRQLVAEGFVNLDLGRNGARGVRVVASQHDGLDAQLVQRPDRVAAAVLTVSATANRASTRSPSVSRMTVLPCSSSPPSCASRVGEHTPNS